jgi:acylphosphatase
MPGWEMVAHGRVQGVGFRWFVQNCALRFGIKGYVKNQPDGTVLIIATGNTEYLQLFSEAIRQGNSHAQVSQLITSELAQHKEYEEFFIA